MKFINNCLLQDPDAALFQSELALLLRGDAPPAVAPMDDDLDW